MEETILTWNVTNWITVILMAALGFLLLAVVAQFFHAGKSAVSTSKTVSQYGPSPALTGNSQ
jgi:hypothetical protein